MSENSKSSRGTKPCSYCGSPMSAEAKLCPVCRSYQSAWRTTVIYMAGIAGLISLVGSAGAFIVGEVPDLWRVLAWKDQVKVFDFETGLYPSFSVSLSNVGDGTVMVSQIFAIMPDGYNVSYPINKTLLPGESLALSGEQVFSPYYDGYIYTKSGTANSTVLANAGLPWPGEHKTPCFGEILFNTESFLLSRMRDHVKAADTKLVEANVQALVLYNSLHYQKKIRDPFPVVATFLQSSSPSCGAFDYTN